ncbi:MAG: glycosyltransferase family 10 [Candidatus Deferrimicrobiaceae bacterium]
MNAKPTVRLDFCDFNGIDKNDNIFTRILSREYRVEINDRPDLVIYSKESHLHRLYTCKKLFWSGETIRPDFSVCDYAMTCYYIDDPRHLRFPYYVVGSGCRPEELLKTPGEVEAVASSGRKFCSFVISNANPNRAGRRLDFFRRLCRYKPVDSGGKGLNNIGRVIPPGAQAKYDFIRGYKFNLCFENKAVEGYTTEKLVEAMWARCIPIYWGNPKVGLEFNTRSFLSLQDYRTEEEFLEAIIEVDRDDAKYRRMLAEPYFPDNRVNEYYDEDRVLAFFKRIMSDPTLPVSRRKRYWPLGRWRLAKRMYL